MPTGDLPTDEPRPVATSRDSRFSLTVEEAVVLYEKAGHPRTPRTIQRYCATGHLESIKIDPAVNDKYLIDPVSLSRHVAQLEELSRLDFRATGRDASRPVATEETQELTGDRRRQEGATGGDMSSPVAQPDPEKIEETTGDQSRPVATTENSVSPPVAPVQPAMSGYVAQLEKRIEEKDDFIGLLKGQLVAKDEQIGELSTRYRETHALLGAMQRMFAPLLGQADPYKPRDREAPASVDNSPSTTA